MKNSLLLCFLGLFFFLSSCDKEDTEPVSEIHISQITLEESYALGQSHEINLTIIKPTPCHMIEEEDVTVSGTTFSYYFRLANPSQFCIQVLARDQSVNIDFEPAVAGEHTLKFYINDELYETRTVLVTE